MKLLLGNGREGVFFSGWHRIVPAAAPGVAAADAFDRQGAARQRAVGRHGGHRKLGAGGGKTAATRAAKQQGLRRSQRQTIAAHRQNQDVLERVHGLIFEQMCAPEGGEKILFHGGKRFAGDGITGDQNELHRLGKLMLVQPETLTQQAPGAAAGGGIANFLTGNDPEPGHGGRRQGLPIGNQAAQRKSLAL